MTLRRFAVSFLALALAAAPVLSGAGPLRARLIERMKEKSVGDAVDPAQFVAGATRTTVSYGSSAAQSLDIYTPPHAQSAPVIVMVHGGGWRIGDKTSRGVVENKLKHWLPQGFVLVSVNYRMLPDAQVDVQAQDVATAVSYVESHAAEWGGDGGKVILMGHSAGAHLVALLSADPSRVGSKWRGTVVLDSAAYDVAYVMQGKHPKLYDDAFGTDPAYWARLSPAMQIKPDAVPMMLVCSLKRPDHSCDQSKAFAEKLKAAGMEAPVVPQDLTHMEVNANLGLPGDYTAQVDAFIAARLKP